jgi:hypothetical protein
MQYGHVDALSVVLDRVPRADYDSVYEPWVADALGSVLPMKGSVEEKSAWVAANKDNLVFDKTTRKYVVKDPGTGVDGAPKDR